MPDIPGDTGRVEALAITGGVVVAAGTDAEMAPYIGEATEVVDLGGRCVIPGLLDNHIHFVRAGLTWNRELRWERCTTVADGLAIVADAVAARSVEEWILVIGGWHEKQFAEGRAPTAAELDLVAPETPVFLQMLYDWALVNAAGMRSLGLTPELAREAGADLFEWDENGALTGRVLGMEGCKWLYSRLPAETFEDQVASTASLSRDLNRFAVTGLVDGGGVSTSPDVYDAVYETDHRGQLTVRAFLTVHASSRGLEQEEMAGYLRFGRPHHRSAMLGLLGAGEVVLYALHDRVHVPVTVTEELREEYFDLLSRMARKRWTVQMHAHRPETIGVFLDTCERVAKTHDIRSLRWGLVHGETLTLDQVAQMARLGVSAVTQSLMRFLGDQMAAAFSPEIVENAPPMRALLDAGVRVSGGTDAMRGASFDPFTSLHFYLTGRMIGGEHIIAERNLLTREEALRIYTRGTAYDCFAEDRLGSLQPGFSADLAVLSKDYFSVDVDEVLSIESELTLVGGKTVYSDQAFAHVRGAVNGRRE